MRRGTGYKIVGGILIAGPVLGVIALLLPGDPPRRVPGWLWAVIGFVLYRHGMRLAAQEYEPPQPSIHSAVISVWLRQLVSRLRGK
jgi:hypothetical protein